MHRFLGLFLCLTLAGFAPASASAQTPERCGAFKLKGAAKGVRKQLGCHAKAVKKDLSVATACLERAGAKALDAFAKAEDGGGCATIDDFAAVDALVDQLVASVVAALAADDTDAARRCGAGKLKGAGKNARALLFCYSKSLKRGEAPDPECVVRADARLDDEFLRAEGKGGCSVIDDAAAVEAVIDPGVVAIVAALSPLCGDDIAGPGQQCDGADDGACPGLCVAGCACIACGDGIATFPEQCDDGGTADGDGCSAACQLEDASALCAGVASSAGTAVTSELFLSGLDQPIHVAAAPLDPNRLFVVEREGRILVVENGVLLPTPFLDITGIVSCCSVERGLFSMAFHPDYATNGRFFVNYTDTTGNDTVTARYEVSGVDPNVADPSSARILLEIAQFATNHNGGQIAFGPDGYLYLGNGDGGGGGDPNENGQDDGELLGKMLRLDVDVETPPYYAVPLDNPGYVDGTSDLELIWAKGLRNPWRFSFDRATGDLLIADVGQGAREEIDYQSAASGGGENYGWDIFEGTACFEPAPAPDCPDPPTGFTFPIHEYTHAEGFSITGGHVYNGCALPDLHDTYFYADFVTEFVRTFEVNGGVPLNHQDRTSALDPPGASIDSIASFGEDARGELYIVDLGGEIFKVVPAP